MIRYQLLKVFFLLVLSGTFFLSAEKSISQNREPAVNKEKNLLLLIPSIVSGGMVSPPPASGSGHITFTIEHVQDVRSEVYRIEARQGAVRENISNVLNSLSPVAIPYDRMLNSSPDGNWLVLGTTRFHNDCMGWECLAIVKGDLSSGSALIAGGQLVHPEGWSAVSSSGDMVIFPQNENGRTDLFKITKNSNSTWSSPLNLTGNTSAEINIQPAISDDGKKIVYQCNRPQQSLSEAICEINIDGSGFRVAVTAEMIGSTFLNQPDYAPGGSIVFEDAGGAEQIWRMPQGSSTPVKITGTFSNDNSPCVLPDGRVASLWIRDNPHELKVMQADGSSYFMLMEGIDIRDIGLGCSR